VLNIFSEKDKKTYKEMVKILAERSTCDRARVGCLLIKNGRIISSGFNGSLPKEPHCDDEGHLIKEGHCIRTIHAEQNALMNCCKQGISTQDCVCIVTHIPCQICTKLLIQAGIKTIYYIEDYRNGENNFIHLIQCEKL